jgi:hypothetical protein
VEGEAQCGSAVKGGGGARRRPASSTPPYAQENRRRVGSHLIVRGYVLELPPHEPDVFQDGVPLLPRADKKKVGGGARQRRGWWRRKLLLLLLRLRRRQRLRRRREGGAAVALRVAGQRERDAQLGHWAVSNRGRRQWGERGVHEQLPATQLQRRSQSMQPAHNALPKARARTRPGWGGGEDTPAGGRAAEGIAGAGGRRAAAAAGGGPAAAGAAPAACADDGLNSMGRLERCCSAAATWAAEGMAMRGRKGDALSPPAAAPPPAPPPRPPTAAVPRPPPLPALTKLKSSSADIGEAGARCEIDQRSLSTVMRRSDPNAPEK